MHLIQNKLAIVTGASSGIGKAIAAALLGEGTIVVNADIVAPPDPPSLPGYHFVPTDVTNAASVNALYSKVHELGVPSILVCNAGKGIHEKLGEGDPEKWARVIDLNITGTLRILRSFLPALTSGTEPANIIFISSIAAKSAYEYGGVYAATKAAVNMIAETLRLETKGKARITVIAPGVVDTGFFSNLESGQLDVESIGLGALDPAEVAEAVLYAISLKPAQVLNYIELRPILQVP
ncbi:SDR family oxidoreductase [Aridibaculum aurantiacum]|uniref:SDR family oxidoreductase n=1 Tax=Aridibaculum aurantiacum TaxID=2810307 RepID=UPI001A9571EE|nr:SDR family oxidoreductase [Aridibaculum aurantiacum]